MFKLLNAHFFILTSFQCIESVQLIQKKDNFPLENIKI